MSSDITKMLPAGQNPLVENYCVSQKVVTLSFEVLAVHAAPQMNEAELTAKPQPPPKSTTSPLMPTTFPDFTFLHKLLTFLYFLAILHSLKWFVMFVFAFFESLYLP